MEIEALLAIGMFLTAIIALLAGYSVAFTLGGVALLFALLGSATGHFNLLFIRVLPDRILGAMENAVLIAVPLFVIMGVILERSKVAEDLLHIASRLLARVRGGLGYAVILVGALLAASTGIVGATVITMTLIALPTMLKQGYSPRLASGTIAASGTLGQIIPPSIVLILLADAISNASSVAAGRAGGGESGVVSVGDLFAGALIPGLILVGVYLIYVAGVAMLRPGAVPKPEPLEDDAPLSWQEIAFGLGAPLALILAVLGSILGGIASPTQAAAIGALGAMLLAGLRLSDGGWPRPVLLAGLGAAIALLLLSANVDMRLGRETSTPIEQAAIALGALFSAVLILAALVSLLVLSRAGQFHAAMSSAVQITSMVFLILFGAALFSLVFKGYGGDDLVEALLTAMPGGVTGALFITLLVMFLLGFFLDFIEIIFVIVPLVAPPLILLGVDPIWLAILMALNLQTSFLTPPFGFALFYLRGAAPEDLRTIDIWKGAVPFIGLQLLIIALVASVPAVATWLPGVAGR
jgi:TRAP-type mannitol/chloroaromatic compound transport system permease large subunit